MNHVSNVIPMFMGEVGFICKKETLKVYSYLIYTEKGIYLFDTGLNTLFISDIKAIMEDLAVFMNVKVDAEHMLRSKLAEHGLEPVDLKGVICSHLHFDHAGGLRVFEGTDVPLYVNRREYEYAQGSERSFEYKKQDHDFLKKTTNVVWTSEDMNIDGMPCMKLIQTPGHSAGHQSLILTGRERRLLLTGDAVYSWDNMKSNRVPPYPFKKQQAADSLDRLNRISGKCDQVICGHDCDEFMYRSVFLDRQAV